MATARDGRSPGALARGAIAIFLLLAISASWAQVTATKSFAPATVALGDRSRMTIEVNNTGGDITSLSLTERLPAGMIVADPTRPSSTCGVPGLIIPRFDTTPGSSEFNFFVTGSLPSFPALASGTSCTISFDVATTSGGNLFSPEIILFVDNALTVNAASATLAVTVTPQALRLEVVNDPVPAGATVELAYTLSNRDRSFPATAVGFVHDLNATLAGLEFTSIIENGCGGSFAATGVTTVTYSGGSIASGASCALRILATVPSAAAAGDYPSITGALSADVNGSPVAGNVASDLLVVSPAPILTKEYLEVGTLAPDPVVTPGDDVVLRFTIVNPSTTSAATDIAFVDTLSSQGNQAGFGLPLTILASDLTDPCGAGSLLDFSVTDLGSSQFVDATFTGGSLAADDSCTFDLTISLPDDLAPRDYINLTDPISGTVDGASREGRSATDTLTVIAGPQLAKSFADERVAPGQTTTLEFRLANANGDDLGDATDISFSDDLGAMLAGTTAILPATPTPPCGAGSTLSATAGGTNLEFSGGSLAPGEVCTFSVPILISDSAASGAYVNMTSDVTATVAARTLTSAPAIAPLQVGGVLFSMLYVDDPAAPGDDVTVRYELVNLETTPTDIVGFADSLDAENLSLTVPSATLLLNTCGGTVGQITPEFGYSGGTIPASGACAVEILMTVPGSASPASYGNDGVTLRTVLGDTPPASDRLIVGDPIETDLIEESAPLFSKAFSPDTIIAGETSTLTFTIDHTAGTEAAGFLSFTDPLPAGVTVAGTPNASTTCTGGTITAAPGTGLVSYAGGSLAGGASCTVQVDVAAAAPNIFVNISRELTSSLGNSGTATATLTVNPPIDDDDDDGDPTIPVTLERFSVDRRD